MHDALALLTSGRIKAGLVTRARLSAGEPSSAFNSFAKRPRHLKTEIVM